MTEEKFIKNQEILIDILRRMTKPISDEQDQLLYSRYLERLRDEFAMHIKIDDLTLLTAEVIMGCKRPVFEIINMEVIQWWLDAESKYRYMQADAILKAREIKP